MKDIIWVNCFIGDLILEHQSITDMSFLRHSMHLGVFKFMYSLPSFTIMKLISLTNLKTILILSIHQRFVTKCQTENIEKGFGVESVTSRSLFFSELKVKTKGLTFTQNKMESLLFSIRNIINKKKPTK